jgi:hypothetical protein
VTSPELHPQPRRQRFEHFLMGRVDFLGLERAGRLAVLEAVTNDLLAVGVGGEFF